MKKQISLIGFIFGIMFLLIILKNNSALYLLQNANYGMQRVLKEKCIDNLFLGSSVFRQGIDTKVMEEKGIDNAFVLSYNGNQPYTELLELEYLLDNGVKINNLYVDLYVNSIISVPWLYDDKLLLETDIKFKRKLWKQLDDNNEIKLTDFIQFWCTSNNELLLTWPIYYPIVNNSFYRGGTLLESASMKCENKNYSSFNKKNEKINVVQRRAIQKIIQLAKENDINIIYLEPPQYYVLQTDEEYLSSLENYVDILDKENVEYILMEKSAELLHKYNYKTVSIDTNSLENFSDYVHCSSEGRETYTKRLCDVIQ